MTFWNMPQPVLIHSCSKNRACGLLPSVLPADERWKPHVAVIHLLEMQASLLRRHHRGYGSSSPGPTLVLVRSKRCVERGIVWLAWMRESTEEAHRRSKRTENLAGF